MTTTINAEWALSSEQQATRMCVNCVQQCTRGESVSSSVETQFIHLLGGRYQNLDSWDLPSVHLNSTHTANLLVCPYIRFTFIYPFLVLRSPGCCPLWWAVCTQMFVLNRMWTAFELVLLRMQCNFTRNTDSKLEHTAYRIHNSIQLVRVRCKMFSS